MSDDQQQPEIGSVTRLIARLKTGGDQRAEFDLWERYFDRLLQRARWKLNPISPSECDAEDVALSTFNAFFVRLSAGRLDEVEDRYSLWNHLSLLLLDHLRNEYRHRGSLKIRLTKRASELVASSTEENWEQTLLEASPTDSDAAGFCDLLADLLGLLPADLRSIADAKMNGDSTAEIAARFRVTPRTLERKIELIRRLWAARLKQLND